MRSGSRIANSSDVVAAVLRFVIFDVLTEKAVHEDVAAERMRRAKAFMAIMVCVCGRAVILGEVRGQASMAFFPHSSSDIPSSCRSG